MKKRDFLRFTSMAAAGTLIAPAFTFCGSGPEPETTADEESDDKDATVFALPALPYAYDALEPYIDAKTMEIHHSKHHSGYTDKLNKAIKSNDRYQGKTIEEILALLSDSDVHSDLRNNGGGYYNHNLFWEAMSPNGGGAPSGNAEVAISGSFDSYDTFKSEFTKAASSVFGSGWAWLCAKDGKLFITSTPNQDNPLMSNLTEKSGHPILGLDVWEHAYYLKYQNERGNYIENFFEVINWDQVNAQLQKA